jgi:hypothetical protein
MATEPADTRLSPAPLIPPKDRSPMQPPPSPQTRPIAAPTFSLIGRQPLRPAALLLAILLAAGSLSLIRYALAHSSNTRLGADGTPSSSGDNSDNNQDDRDDPNQIDTIVLGDPSEAPAPARHGNHVSSVHPTLLIVLPRSGKDFGMIPNTPAGQLLYAWLAAFNQADTPALARALPTFPQAAASDAEMSLRQQTGGFNLVSAKEVQPGLLLFRLRDQTPAAHEVLGTLFLRPGSGPAAIASFSLRAIPPPAPPKR